MSDPITDFFVFKRAALERVNVRSHTRIRDGKLQYVKKHEREEETPGPENATLTRAQTDLLLWEQWNEGGRKKEDLAPLLRVFEPTVQKYANTYKGKVRIPDKAIELRFRTELLNACRSYNPNKGASLHTYVYTYLNKGKRWIGASQNIGRIPENRLYKIRQFNEALDSLAEDLQDAPTDEQLSKHLEWSVPEVARMRTELRKDLIAQNFEGDTHVHIPSRTAEVIRNFVYELSGKDRLLYQHLTGQGAEQVSSTSELAKILNEETYDISRRKKRIANKLKVHLND